MNINRLLEITNDLERCALCPDKDYGCEHCDVDPDTQEELREYYQQVRGALAENAALREKLEQEYINGAKYAIYEIMKEADIPGSQAIRDSGGTIDMMCAAVADKIREVLEHDALKAENAKLRSKLKTMQEEYLETCFGECESCRFYVEPDADDSNTPTEGYCSIRAELKEE